MPHYQEFPGRGTREEVGRAQEGGSVWGPCLVTPPVKVFPFKVLLQPAWTEDTIEGREGDLVKGVAEVVCHSGWRQTGQPAAWGQIPALLAVTPGKSLKFSISSPLTGG